MIKKLGKLNIKFIIKELGRKDSKILKFF